MVAAPQNGTLTFVGSSGRIYNIDEYSSDVVAALITLSPNGAAGTGSLTYWRCPEDVVLVDYSIVTGLTDTVGLTMQQDGATVPGSIIRVANHLNTNPFRPKLQIAFPAGALVGAVQF